MRFDTLLGGVGGDRGGIGAGVEFIGRPEREGKIRRMDLHDMMPKRIRCRALMNLNGRDFRYVVVDFSDARDRRRRAEVVVLAAGAP
jgi:hypothetical protein